MTSKTTIRRIAILIFMALPVCSLTASDGGLITDNNASYEGVGDGTELKYSGTLMPWFSASLGKSADLYISAKATAQYENKEWAIVPELLRTMITGRIGENGTLSAGRMNYADPLGFVASGLFDGLRYQTDFENGSVLGIGAWYTGFLYKKNVNITMTSEDLAVYEEPLDYGDFFNTYFAPRRLVAAVEWGHPALAESVRFNLALVGQFDLSGNDILYHSQYLIVKAGIPVQNFFFELGACGELVEMENRYQVSFAGELGIAWMLPTRINDRLLLLGRYSGGEVNDTLSAFVPVTTEPQGSIIKEKLSGLSLIKLDYTARLHQTFSISLKSTYFILTDLKTYTGLPGGRDGYFLGNEFYGQVVWSPVSDIRITGGGGVFLPSLGNADKEGDIQWRVDLGVLLVLF